MKTLCILAASIALTASGAVAAQPQANTATTETAATDAARAEPEANVAAEQDKRICKTERVTGSLTRVRRTCMTRGQWDRLAEGSREGVNDIVNDAKSTLPKTTSVTGAY